MTDKKNLARETVCLSAFTYIALLFLFSACMKVDDSLTSTQLTIIDSEGILFESHGGSKTFEVESSRDWTAKVVSGNDWIDVSPTKGSNKTSKLTVIAKRNEGNTREGSFTITSSSLNKTITISQKGKDAPVLDYVTIKDIRDRFESSERSEIKIDESLLLKGVVISDKEGANRSAKRDGFIQDNAGSGIAFRVTQNETPYELGDELLINLNGATIRYFDYAGIVQLVFSKMDTEVVNQNVFVSPKEVTIDELEKGDYDGVLVKIKNVQFDEYESLSYYHEGNSTTRLLECADGSSIEVKTMKSASFGSETLPAGSGNIVGIASFCKEKWVLQMRNLDDVDEMSNKKDTRFVIEEPPVIESKITITALRTLLKDGAIYNEDSYIEGEVILNASKGNIINNKIYLADETAGVVLTFFTNEDVTTHLPLGAKVKVNLKGLKSKEINGLMQLGDDNTLSISAIEMVEQNSSTPLQPKPATIDELLLGKYQAELVKIEHVQFKNIEERYLDTPYIIDEKGNQLQVYTREEAHFAGRKVKEGMGTIVAVASVNQTPQLLIRSLDDLDDMKSDRFNDISDTPYITPSKKHITFNAKDGTENITINANVNWQVFNETPWLSVTPTAGESDEELTITASENEGEQRRATLIITNLDIIETIEVVQEGVIEEDSGLCEDLFFSEYIEGSSYNKYLEIYNGTGKVVDLSDYMVETYINGQTKAKYVERLFGFLKSGEVIVLENSRSYLYYDENSIVSTTTNFNGNDAVALVKAVGDTFVYVDIIGSIGEDPGKEWVDSNDKELTTLDRTLVRKPYVRKGITKNPKKGFPTLSTEWISYPIDTVDFLGSHSIEE